jgi:chemotaxis protein CheX
MEQYIVPFISVCSSVFKKLLDYEPKAGYPFFATREQAKNWDISAIISLSGDAKGTVTLSMKNETALAITNKLTGKTHTYPDEEVMDVIGETVNIITGNVTREFEDRFNLDISVPRIIRGKSHEILWSGAHARIMSIPFELPGNHSFHLSVVISSTKGN